MTVKNNILPAMVWLAGCALLTSWRFDAISFLFALRGGIVFVCLLMRHQSQATSRWDQKLIAWGSAALPLFMRWEMSTSLNDLLGVMLIVGGTGLVAWSCVDLGRSFGISPAVRPFVATGIYNWVSHPMYLGHCLVELGIVVVSPTSANLAIACTGWGLYLLRNRWESALISQCSAETKSIRIVSNLSTPNLAVTTKE